MSPARMPESSYLIEARCTELIVQHKNSDTTEDTYYKPQWKHTLYTNRYVKPCDPMRNSKYVIQVYFIRVFNATNASTSNDMVHGI